MSFKVTLISWKTKVATNAGLPTSSCVWCHVFTFCTSTFWYVWFPFSAAVRGAFQPQAKGDSLCQSQPQQIHGHWQNSLHRWGCARTFSTCSWHQLVLKAASRQNGCIRTNRTVVWTKERHKLMLTLGSQVRQTGPVTILCTPPAQRWLSTRPRQNPLKWLSNPSWRQCSRGTGTPPTAPPSPSTPTTKSRADSTC